MKVIQIHMLQQYILRIIHFFFKIIINFFYQSITTMITVGYGDIKA